MKSNGHLLQNGGQAPAPSYKRTILITGATDGIGKAAAIELAAKTRENFVIIHGRNQRNCERTLQEIAIEQKVLAPSNVAFVCADFSDFQQVSWWMEGVLSLRAHRKRKNRFFSLRYWVVQKVSFVFKKIRFTVYDV
jgi:NAD(P)-dependent dehydrogenase (short-subunit alcohol dehydrogenase family)